MGRLVLGVVGPQLVEVEAGQDQTCSREVQSDDQLPQVLDTDSRAVAESGGRCRTVHHADQPVVGIARGVRGQPLVADLLLGQRT